MKLFTRPEVPPPPTPADRPAADSPPPNWVEALAASIGVSVAIGIVVGFVVGGIGGRIAMRILFLTSNEHVKGVTSDDGFEIGVISFATIFLLILTSILGGAVGGGYGFLRMFVTGPRWLTTLGFGIAFASFGGAMLVQSHGIDFRFLGPLWLAVALFVAIPAVWALTMVLTWERLLRSRPRRFLPARIAETRWGLAGWGILAVMTAVGLFDLLNDIEALRR